MLLLLVMSASFGYLAVGKAMMFYDCSMQAFVPSAALFAPPGELVAAASLLGVTPAGQGLHPAEVRQKRTVRRFESTVNCP
eukprot:4296428-Pyramimonas_sp.AAC.1